MLLLVIAGLVHYSFLIMVGFFHLIWIVVACQYVFWRVYSGTRYQQSFVCCALILILLTLVTLNDIKKAKGFPTTEVFILNVVTGILYSIGTVQAAFVFEQHHLNVKEVYFRLEYEKTLQVRVILPALTVIALDNCFVSELTITNVA